MDQARTPNLSCFQSTFLRLQWSQDASVLDTYTRSSGSGTSTYPEDAHSSIKRAGVRLIMFKIVHIPKSLIQRILLASHVLQTACCQYSLTLSTCQLRHLSTQVPFVLIASALGVPVVELEARQSCSKAVYVHAAGTTEIGLGIVGTPLSAALASSG